MVHAQYKKWVYSIERLLFGGTFNSMHAGK
jgi:hypothetical protein